MSNHVTQNADGSVTISTDGAATITVNSVAPAPVPTPTPAPTPTPVPTPTPAPQPGGTTVVLQNMTEVNPGHYRSNNLGVDQKCYVQLRLASAPQKLARLTCRRLTNVIPDGKLNLKTMRAWPESGYPDDYVARGINEGAEKFTTENPTASGYFSIPWKNGVWMNEVYEFDYANKKVTITIDGMVWTQAWNFGTLNRTQFGVQLVCANPNSGAELPIGSYVEFDSLKLEYA